MATTSTPRRIKGEDRLSSAKRALLERDQRPGTVESFIRRYPWAAVGGVIGGAFLLMYLKPTRTLLLKAARIGASAMVTRAVTEKITSER